MEKHGDGGGGGDAPALHHIEVETADADAERTSHQDANDNIQELRQFIMGMMHTEMELVERIKQSEERIGAVNSRIEEFVGSVETEKRRSRAIQTRLQSSMEDLRALEDKKTVLDAKYRQFQEMVEAHSLECRTLRSQHQWVRDILLRSEKHVNANQRLVASFTSSTEDMRRSCVLEMEEASHVQNIDILRSELQKLRAKRRHIDQQTEMLGYELLDMNHVHEKLVLDLEAARFDRSEQKAKLEAFNQDCSRRRSYIIEEVHGLRLLHEQSNKKLKAKQKKYRVKTRAEIATLRKRVAFLTTELENHEMNAEDILSSIAPFRDQREILESRKAALETEMANCQERIACAQGEVESFDSCKEKFDVRKLRANLTRKNEEVDQAVQVLKAKKDELIQLQEDEGKLLTEVDNVDRLIGESSDASVDKELVMLTATKKEHIVQHESLGEREREVKDTCERLTVDNQRLQKQHKRLKTATAKVHRELRKMSHNRDLARDKLEKKQKALAAIDEAAQKTKRLEDELQAVQATHAEELNKLEQELFEKEEEWKHQRHHEESRLEMELQDWNAKLEALQSQLQAL